MADHSGLRTVPLESLLGELKPLIIGFQISTDHPTWATCFLVDGTIAPQPPTYQVVKTDEYKDAAALKAAIPSHLIIDQASPWIAKSKHDTTTVVLSTLSGTGQASRFFKSMLKPLLEHFGLLQGHHFTMIETDAAEDIHDFASIILALRAQGAQWQGENGRFMAAPIEQNIILLSGDGGVSDIINGILGVDAYPKVSDLATAAYHQFDPAWSAPIINLIPMGTGNALANSNGIIGPGDKTFGLRSLFCGQPEPVPIFRVDCSLGTKLLSEGTDDGPLENKRPDSHQHFYGPHGVFYGAVVCSWGLHASLVADSDTEEYRKHGDKRFAMVAENLVNPADGNGPHSYKGELKVGTRNPGTAFVADDSFDVPREHGYILATFCSKLDANFTVSPQSRPLDDRLMLVRFGPQNDAQEIWRLLANGQGVLVTDQAVTYREFNTLRITFDEDDAKWRRVCIDGTIIQMQKGGALTVVKHDEEEIVRLRVVKEKVERENKDTEMKG